MTELTLALLYLLYALATLTGLGVPKVIVITMMSIVHLITAMR